MKERKKPYRINFINNGKDPAPALRALVKEAISKVLERHNATSPNLDEVLEK